MKEDHQEQINQEQDNQQKESQHQRQVKLAFINYSTDMRITFQKIYGHQKMKNYFNLVRQRKREKMEIALQANQKFLNHIIESTYNEEMGNQTDRVQITGTTACHNISKIRTTVKQFFRQWCSQSPEIKDYLALVEKTKKYLQKGSKVLAPGSGLGRLVLELVEAGFAAQGNQITYFMLFGSNFILNCVEEKQQFQIYPFIHSSNNHHNEEDMFRSVRVPDKLATVVVPEDADFSMAAGEFTQIYGEQTKFDGIVTCFFLDTANNIFQYVDTIKKLLKGGGIWVNLGPLLFHYKDMLDQVSIEISWQQLIQYIRMCGFELLEEEDYHTTYCHDPRSTFKHLYKCKLSVWKKMIDQ